MVTQTGSWTQLKAMTHDNPYYYTIPADEANFVGRQTIVDLVVADLTRPRCDSWAVIGGRRFGKSSLLKAVETQLLVHLSTRQQGDRHIVPIVVDLKRCGVQSEEHIYACILRELNRALRRRRLPSMDLSQLVLPEQNHAKAVSFADFEDTFEELASCVEEYLGPLRIVLLLDEVEAVVHYPWSDTLFNQLRALIYDGFLANTVKLILTGSAGFIKTQEGSPLWNAIKICYLETLSPNSLTELFTLGGNIPGDSAAIIREQSGGHPFVAQYLLHHLWHEKDALAQATIAQVQQVALQMHQDRFDDFQGWWEAIGEEGQRIYALLAAASGELEERLLLTQFTDRTMALDRPLRSLRYHGLVTRSNDLQRYRIAGTLFRDWCLRNVIHRPTVKHNNSPVSESTNRKLPKYQNFDLSITEGKSNKLRIQVQRSSFGDATELTNKPIYTSKAIEPGTLHNLQQMGQEIGNALFTGRISQRFAERLQIGREQGSGIRICLHIDDEHIAQIPWELAKFNDEYLSLRPRTPLVRYISADDPPQALKVNGALRILGITSDLAELPTLNVTREQRELEQAVQPLVDAKRIELQWLPRADKQLLQEKIRQWQPHIVHYIGHGNYDEEQREGYLYFSETSDQISQVSASELAIQLRDSNVRFVLLNACSSGRASGGLAEMLVRRGIPAALGIQTNVSDDVAIAFSRHFYRALSDYWPVDAALVEGRKAIMNRVGLDQPDWAQPILYMRSPDGQLFSTNDIT